MAKLNELFHQKGTHLGITLHHNTPHDAATVMQIACVAARFGRTISIFDMSGITQRGKVHFPEMFLRRTAWQLGTSPAEHLRRLSENLGFAFVRPANGINQEIFSKASNIVKEVPTSLSKLVDWDVFEGQLGPSIASYLTSLVEPSEEVNPSRYESHVFNAIASFLMAKEFIREQIIDRQIDEFSVFNGRFPSMAGASLAAKEMGLRQLWHEIGRTKDFLFAEEFRPHDRIQMQKAMKEFQHEFSAEKLESIMREFIFGRSENSNINPFLLFQNRRVARQRLAPHSITTIFTSSPDETIGIGRQWTDVEWQSQYEAIHQSILRLNHLGQETIVRLHPNLVTKSWREFLRGIRLFRDLPCSLVLPTDNYSSYDLLDVSTNVIVWRSTMGLEACARGVPTFCLGRNRYDTTASVKILPDMSSLQQEFFEPFRVDMKSTFPGILWNRYAGRRETEFVYHSFIEDVQGWVKVEKFLLSIRFVFLPFLVFSKLSSSPRILFQVSSRLIGPSLSAKLFRIVLRLPMSTFEN